MVRFCLLDILETLIPLFQLIVMENKTGKQNAKSRSMSSNSIEII